MLTRRFSSTNPAAGTRPDSQDVGPYLERYGYIAENASTWSKTNNVRDWPVIHVAIPGHEEVDKHTFYFIDCSLSSPRIDLAPLKWRSRRRLCQLREELFDPLKAELRNEAFKKLIPAPFASRGGMPGTTACLNTWCIGLAKAINSGGLAPPLTALTLKFLEAPEWPGATDVGEVDVRIDQDKEAPSQTSSLDVLTGDAEASAEDDEVPSAPGSDYGHPAPRAVSRRNPESGSEDDQEPVVTWNGDAEAFESEDASVEQLGAGPPFAAAEFGLDERPASEASSESSEEPLKVFDLVEASRPAGETASQSLHDLLDPAPATTASGNEAAEAAPKTEEERLAQGVAEAAPAAAAPAEAQHAEEERLEPEGAEATEAAAAAAAAAEAQRAAEEHLAQEAAEAAKKAEEEQRIAREAAEANQATAAAEARLAEEERLTREAAEATQKAEEERLAREAAEAAQAAAAAAEAQRAEEERLEREAAEATQAAAATAAAAETQRAAEERLAQEAAEAAKKAEEEEEERIAREAAEANQAAAAAEAQRAEEERLAQEAAEAAQAAAAAEDVRKAEEERLAQEAAEATEAAAAADLQRSEEERVAQDNARACLAAVAPGEAQIAEEERLAQGASQAARGTEQEPTVQDAAADKSKPAAEASLADLPEEAPTIISAPQLQPSGVTPQASDSVEGHEHAPAAALVTQAAVEAASPKGKDEDSDEF